MSEKSITRQQVGRVRRPKNEPSEPRRSRWGLLWWQIRRVEGRRSIRCASQRSKSGIRVRAVSRFSQGQQRAA